LLSRDLVRQ